MGARQMTRHLQREGHVGNRKRIGNGFVGETGSQSPAANLPILRQFAFPQVDVRWLIDLPKGSLYYWRDYFFFGRKIRFMALLRIRHYPEAVLKEVASPVTVFDQPLKDLARDMAETMYAAPGVGLAAPQVGVGRRLVVIDCAPKDAPPELIVAVNPQIIEREGEVMEEEGCLSVPGYYARVPRSARITARYLDLEGKPVERQADGLLAIAFQHEIDHLDGILFVDHLSPLKKTFFRKKYQKMLEQQHGAAMIAPHHLRTVFMGTPEFSVPTLEGLLASEVQLVGVFSQPDRPKGRGNQLAAPPVKEFALRHGIPVFQPVKLREPAAVEQLRQLAPDLIVVVAFGQILPKSVLEIPRYGCINVHASLLPRYRGASPIHKAIMEGETVTGVTTMLMDVGLDTGPMLVKKSTAIGPEETAGELHERLALLGREAMEETLGRLCAGTLRPEAQDDALSTYAPMLQKEDGRIDWSRPAAAIHNQVRGLDPWPGAFTYLGGELLKVCPHRCRTGRWGARHRPRRRQRRSAHRLRRGGAARRRTAAAGEKAPGRRGLPARPADPAWHPPGALNGSRRPAGKLPAAQTSVHCSSLRRLRLRSRHRLSSLVGAERRTAAHPSAAAGLLRHRSGRHLPDDRRWSVAAHPDPAYRSRSLLFRASARHRHPLSFPRHYRPGTAGRNRPRHPAAVLHRPEQPAGAVKKAARHRRSRR